MRRVVTWSPALAVLAVTLLAAAPAKKSSDVNVSPSPSVTATEQAPALQPSNSAPELSAPETTAPTPVSAVASGATYAIDWYSINGGGTVNATSASYRLGASVGQSVSGAASSDNYRMGIGFWYGAGAPGGCVCAYHGDPNKDGIKVDVLDVVGTVNRAFRGFPALCEADCPAELSDVDCNGFTDVLDVVGVVNVAFRGFPLNTFCNPCVTPPPPATTCN